MEYFIKEISNKFSIGELFWDVVAGFILTILVLLFSKPVSEDKNSISKTWIEIIGVNTSLLAAFFSVILFAFLHFFSFYQNGLGKEVNLEYYLSITYIINFFLISYAVFLLFKAIHSIRLIGFGKATFANLFHNFLLTFLLGVLLAIALLFTKMGIDSATGKALQNENIHAYIVDFYLLRLFKLAIICVSMLFPLMIFKLRRKD